MSKEEFIKKVVSSQNGVQNDSENVFVELDGKFCSVPIGDVLDHPETEPFEASCTLEGDFEHPAWDDLFSQFSE